MSLTELYLLFVVLPGLGSALAVICITGLILYFFALFIAGMIGDVKYDDVSKYITPLFRKWVLIVLILFGLLSAITPSQKDMLLLTGAYAATNSKEMMKLPDNILKAMNTYLDRLNKDNNKKD